MGSLGTTHLISLLLAVASIAATCGFIASAVARRRKRRARVFFIVGFFCGLMTGTILAEGVAALVVSLFTRSRLRHHPFDWDCGRRSGTATSYLLRLVDFPGSR